MTETCPVQFTEKFIYGQPPVKIEGHSITFLQSHQIFVYSPATVYINNKKVNIHAYVKKGSVLKVNSTKNLTKPCFLHILSGIPQDPVYRPLYK